MMKIFILFGLFHHVCCDDGYDENSERANRVQSDYFSFQFLMDRIKILDTRGLVQQHQIDELTTRDRDSHDHIQRLLKHARQQQDEINQLKKRDYERQAEMEELATHAKKQQKYIDDLLGHKLHQQNQIRWFLKRERQLRYAIDRLNKIERNEQIPLNSLCGNERHQQEVIEQHSLPARDELETSQEHFEGRPSRIERQSLLSETKVRPAAINMDATVSYEYGHRIRQGHVQQPTVSRRQLNPSPVPTPKVAFFAALTNHILHAGINQDVIFDDIRTNIGNAYSNRHGVFVAPISGVYGISATVMAYYDLEIICGININGNAVGRMYARGSNSSFDQGSASLVVHLNKGDDVSVKNVMADATYFGGHYTMFSGFLLFHD